MSRSPTPRGTSRQSQSSQAVAAGALMKSTYTSQPAAPTGTYQAVRVPRERRKTPRPSREARSFKVQEFEPDRMKVRMTLVGSAGRRMAATGRRQGPASWPHICSVKPASNRRVEGEMSSDAGAAAVHAVSGAIVFRSVKTLHGAIS